MNRGNDMKLSERVSNKDFRAPAPEYIPGAYAIEPEPFYKIDGREVKHLAEQIAKLEQELTEVKQVEKRYETQNVRLIKENASLKEQYEYLKSCQLEHLKEPKRIAELEQRITELAQQVRIRGERMELMREWLDGSDTYTMSGYDWPKLKSWFDDNGKAL